MFVGIAVNLVGVFKPTGAAPIPANAIRDRASSPILDRSGNYIEVRA